MFILLITKYVNEPLFTTGGRWALRCSSLQEKKFRAAQNQAKVYKKKREFYASIFSRLSSASNQIFIE
jgi:hypothetical protein